MAAPLIGMEAGGRDPGALLPLIVDLADTVDLGHFPVDRFDPKAPFRMLLYSYVTGVFASHQVESNLRERGAYTVLLGPVRIIPADLAEFRSRYHDHLIEAVTEALEVAHIAGATHIGLVDLGENIAETARRLLERAEAEDEAWRRTQGDTLEPNLRVRAARQSALRAAARMRRTGEAPVEPPPLFERPSTTPPAPQPGPGASDSPATPAEPSGLPWDWVLGGAMLFALISSTLTVWLPGYAGAIWTGAAVALTAGFWAVRQASEGRPIVAHWLLLPLALIPAIGLYQLVTGSTAHARRTQEATLQAAYTAGAFFIFLQALSSRTWTGARTFVLRSVTIFALVFGCYSAVQYLSSDGKIFWLVPGPSPGVPLLGPFVNRDHFAVLAELLLPLVLFDLRGRIARRQSAIVPAAAAGSLFGAVVLGASRAGGILAMAAMLLVSAAALLLDSGSARRRANYASLIAALALASAAAVGWEPLLKRFSDPDQWKGRREMNAASWAMFQERPVTGFGLGSWSNVYPSHAVASLGVYANAAHNDWAQFAVEGGVPALAGLAVILLWSVAATFRRWWALGLVLMFIHSAVDFPWQVPALTLWAAFIMAAVAAEDHRSAAAAEVPAETSPATA